MIVLKKTTNEIETPSPVDDNVSLPSRIIFTMGPLKQIYEFEFKTLSARVRPVWFYDQEHFREHRRLVRLSFPEIVLISSCVFEEEAKIKTNLYAYLSIKDKLFPVPLPHIHYNGNVCINDISQSDFSTFWTSPFDLSSRHWFLTQYIPNSIYETIPFREEYRLDRADQNFLLMDHRHFLSEWERWSKIDPLKGRDYAANAAEHCIRFSFLKNEVVQYFQGFFHEKISETVVVYDRLSV